MILPAARGGRIADHGLRRWLGLGQWELARPTVEYLNMILPLMDHELCKDGLASLRFWGQTEERSGAWMAAADPIHLQANLDHLRLYAMPNPQLDSAEIRQILKLLQENVASEHIDFARIGGNIYLRCTDAISSATASPEILNGMPPDEFMPNAAGDKIYQSLSSEIQMTLHESEFNCERENARLPAINSLWIWGGGRAPQAQAKPIFPLFSNDPLFRGYWLSCKGLIRSWPNSLTECAEISKRGFVAVAPDLLDHCSDRSLDEWLDDARQLLRRKAIGRLSLIFRDGLQIELTRRDQWRFWRRKPNTLFREDNE